MLSCKEVATSISSDRLEWSGWWHRFEVWMHLLMCRYCRRYAAQIRAINAAARGLFESSEEERQAAARLEAPVLDQLRPPEGRRSG